METEWGEVRIKIARWPSGEMANASPEYEDCRKLATRALGAAEAGDAGGHAGLRRKPQAKEGHLMDRAQIEALLNEVREGRTEVDRGAGPAARPAL